MPQPSGRAPVTLRGRLFAQTLLKCGQSQSESWRQSRRWFVFLAINSSMPYWIQTLPSLEASWWALNLCDLFLTNKKQNNSILFFFRLSKVNKHTNRHTYKSPDKQAGGCMRSVVAALILEGFPQFVCVWARGRKGACKGTVSLWKTSMKQHCVWFTVRIRLRICMGLILWEVACEQWRNVVLLSTLWCCILIHQKEKKKRKKNWLCWDSALYHIAGAVPTFPAGISSHYTRAHLYTCVIDFAATHCHQVAGIGYGPEVDGFTLLAVGESIAEAGVMVGSKGSACVTS